LEGLNIQGAIETGTGKEALRAKLAIIEGFLLYPDPSIYAAADSQNPDHDKENELPIPQNDLGGEHGTSEDRTMFDLHEAEVAAYETINAAARQDLIRHFDIKLFLPISMQQAKQRRFVRHCYIDALNGERLRVRCRRRRDISTTSLGEITSRNVPGLFMRMELRAVRRRLRRVSM
jgi:hypothetical protein